MDSKDSSLISDFEEQKWVVEISEILNHRLKINAKIPSVSIFQLPKTITTTKPEAYEPQQIELGPLHHFRPEPYKKKEQKKLDIGWTVIRDYEIKDFLVTLLDKVQQLVSVIRSSYDMFLQGDDKSLAWVFALDGLFLLDLFHTYDSELDKEKEDYLLLLKTKANEMKQKQREEYLLSVQKARAYKAMAKNRMKKKMESSEDIPDSIAPHHKEVKENSENETENIIPDNDLPSSRPPKEIVVTEENYIQWERALGLPHYQLQLQKKKVDLKKRLAAQDILMVENQIPYIMLKEIAEALHSVLGNSSSSSHGFSPSVFQSFCKIHSPLELCSNDKAPISVEHLIHYMYYSIVSNVMQEPGGDQNIDVAKLEDGRCRKNKKKAYPVANLFDLVVKLPQKEASEVYEKSISVLEAFSQSKTIVPSASKLHVDSGFEFHTLEKYKGIQNISVDEKKISLPCVTLNKDSEVVLGNLVAYETITADSDSSFPLTEYMGFMCALIMNVDDVKLLKNQNVIKGELREDEIAQLFIGMSNSIPTAKAKGKSKLLETIDKINKVYESRLKMKAYLLLKKLARSLLVALKAVGGFVESTWKIVAFMVSIVTVFLLTSQAYCDTYGCTKMTATLLPYASS